MITGGLVLLVVMLAGAGGWRLWVLSRDVALLDRAVERLHAEMSDEHLDRLAATRECDSRKRQTEAVEAQLQGAQIALRQRVDGMEPWVRMWASASERR